MTKILKVSENSTVFVNGRITSSSVTTRKRIKSDFSRKVRTYTSIVLHDAKILESIPGQITLEELHAHYKFFPSKISGFGFVAVNDTENMPKIHVANSEGKYHEASLNEELTQGVNVTLELKVEHENFVLTNVYVNEVKAA